MRRQSIRFLDEEEAIIQQVQRENRNASFHKAVVISIRERPRLLDRIKQLEQSAQVSEASIDETNVQEKTELKSSIPSCFYASLVEGKVYCDDPRKKGLPRDRRVPIPVCERCFNRKEAMRKKKTDETPEKNEKELGREAKIISSPLSKPKPDLEEIVDQLGVCENPHRMRKTRFFVCAICKKRIPDKRQSCDEIVEELRTHPLKMRNFINGITSKQSPRQTDSWEDPEFDEIEKMFGFYDPEFEKIRKLFHELCENCESLPPKGGCQGYCSVVLKRLREPQVAPLS